MTHQTAKLGPSTVDLEIPELALRARSGSLPAMNELVVRFESRLLNFLVRRTGSRADAEDLTQETFVRAWQRIDRYDPRWQFSTWLFTIGGRLAISHHRRSRREMPGLSARPTEASHQDDSSRSVDDRDDCEHLWRLADRILTDTQRAALWLRYAEDLTAGEIGRILGKTGISIRVTLLRARKILAEHVAAGRSVAAARTRAPGRYSFAARGPQPLQGDLGGES